MGLFAAWSQGNKGKSKDHGSLAAFLHPFAAAGKRMSRRSAKYPRRRHERKTMRAVEDAGPYDILLSPLQRVGNVTMVFGKGKGKRWKGGGGRGILTVLGDGAMGRRLPKEKEVML